MDDYKQKILIDKNEVRGEIYIITNRETKMCYVGQTLTHRKNNSKYRPFGYIGRLKDHLSEARKSTKLLQCRFLNNAIRKYGESAFEVQLIETCDVKDLDEREKHYIQSFNTLYPDGYNLTTGGRSTRYIRPGDKVETIQLNKPGKRGGCTSRSSETRAKMSKQLKESLADTNVRKALSKRTQTQHLDAKYTRFKDVKIDLTKLEDYLIIRNSKNHGQFILVNVNGVKARFVGRYTTLDELKQRALTFLTELSATLSN